MWSHVDEKTRFVRDSLPEKNDIIFLDCIIPWLKNIKLFLSEVQFKKISEFKQCTLLKSGSIRSSTSLSYLQLRTSKEKRIDRLENYQTILKTFYGNTTSFKKYLEIKYWCIFGKSR